MTLEEEVGGRKAEGQPGRGGETEYFKREKVALGGFSVNKMLAKQT